MRRSWSKKKLRGLSFKAEQRTQSILGLIRGNAVNVHWWNDLPNFGDLITPFLLRKYGLTPVFASMEHADLVSTGSLLTNLSEDYSGYILGSGLIKDTVRIFRAAKIIGVRGELTRERINAPKSTILGDPGLLIAEFFEKKLRKTHKLGIVPHYVDKEDARVFDISARYPKEVIVVDIQRKPQEVVRELDGCEFVLSSSLHGLVAADALNIPNGWIVLSDKVSGQGFKFFDYASAFGEKYEPHEITGMEKLSDLVKMTHQVSSRVATIKSQLNIAFQNLRDEILAGV